MSNLLYEEKFVQAIDSAPSREAFATHASFDFQGFSYTARLIDLPKVKVDDGIYISSTPSGFCFLQAVICFLKFETALLEEQ